MSLWFFCAAFLEQSYQNIENDVHDDDNDSGKIWAGAETVLSW